MNEPVENSVDYVNNSPEEAPLPLTWRDAAAPLLALALALLYRAVFPLVHFGCYGPGIGVPVFVGCYFGGVFLMLGRRAHLTPGAILLLSVSMALSLFCAGSSLPGLTVLNCFILLFTAAGATFLLSGQSRFPLRDVRILPETVRLSVLALFSKVSRPFQILSRIEKGKKGALGRSLLTVLLTIALLCVVLALLSSADAAFGSIFEKMLDRLRELSPGASLWKVLRALALALFIASGLYFLQVEAPSPKTTEPPAKERHALPWLLPATLLNLVYLLYCGIQVSVSYAAILYAAVDDNIAQYARAGFFQLVAVAAINLTFCLLATHKECFAAKGGLPLRISNGLMLLLTLGILTDAYLRMHFYVLTYGLSLLRLMTLWGMLAIAVGILAAGWKLFRPDFSFFRVFAPFVLVSWCLFCLLGPGRIIANYNVGRYTDSGYTETLDRSYLIDLGPAALPALYDLRDTAPGKVNPAINAICRDMEDSSRWTNWKFSYLYRED